MTLRVLSRGLTLIEVLIASTILFAAITVVSETYRTSLAASDKAERLVRLVTPLPLITAKIRDDLRTNPQNRVTGSGEFLGVVYSFEATSIAFEPPARRFDPDMSGVVDYAPRYRLYDVTVALKLGSARRSYIYQEIAWLPEAERLVSP
jgi:hypothetical protein